MTESASEKLLELPHITRSSIIIYECFRSYVYSKILVPEYCIRGGDRLDKATVSTRTIMRGGKHDRDVVDATKAVDDIR